jgi:23S rRNA pseudouridine2604 synthase
MCEYFGYEVTKLERVRIMNVSLKGLPLGDWRDLTENEMKVLMSMTADSTSTTPTKKNPKTEKQIKGADQTSSHRQHQSSSNSRKGDNRNSGFGRSKHHGSKKSGDSRKSGAHQGKKTGGRRGGR